MEYKISFPTPLDEILDITNGNSDVIISVEDGREYVLTVATPDNLKQLMAQENKSYLSPGLPLAIVDMITEENVNALVKAFLESDPIYLKIYGCDVQDL